MIGFILLCQAAGAIGSIFTIGSIPTWYAGLVKPSFNPPNWIFGPVWTTLYTLMGIAMYLVYQRGGKSALQFFGVHLVVNALWTIIFFGLHNMGLALGVIVLLWLMIAWSIYIFGRIRPLAGWLLVPYIFWVSFATALNYSLWMLNYPVTMVNT